MTSATRHVYRVGHCFPNFGGTTCRFQYLFAVSEFEDETQNNLIFNNCLYLQTSLGQGTDLKEQSKVVSTFNDQLEVLSRLLEMNITFVGEI